MQCPEAVVDGGRESQRCRKPEPSRRMAGYLLLVLVVASLAASCRAESQGCAVGLKTPGRTWPAGDIVLEYHSPLRILCILNSTFIEHSFPGKSSLDLVFFKGQRQIDPAYISVLNETTIQLDISEPPPENAMYYCKLKLDDSYEKDYEAVCLNKVVVGYKPSEPKNFGCISRNWENLTCSWEPPQNYVDTTYSITFKLPGRAGGRKVYPCPDDTKSLESGKTKPRNTCFWNSFTDPIYRQPYDYYFFTLNGENVLGNWTGTFKFHHFANVIPAKPTNLTVVNKTLDSALLHWNVPFPMQTFPPGLNHRVAYQNQWDSRETWKVVEITKDVHNASKYYNLTGLKYANTIYDIRVFMKSAAANGDDKWSNFSGITFRTPARIPGQSPRTDYGSFEIQENMHNRDIYLYWQSVPAYLENGNEFRYQVTYVEENGKRLFLHPNETTRTYARFRELSLHSRYRFEIVAVNEVGVLEDPAKILVLSRDRIPNEPVSFTKIAFDDGLYELSWKPPIKGDRDVTNYTIFWCDNDRDRPYQCQGYLEWVHVPKTTFVRNVTVPDPRKVYQFAISANTPYGSSGMTWATCTVIHNRVVGKMKNVWINHIGSSVIEVGWKLECSDRIGVVDGFKIYYCPIISPYNLNCKGPKQNITIKAESNTIRGEVRNLKPYTTYMLAVAVVTKNGEGQHSDPLYNTTLESPPSDPPHNVIVRNVTNTTVAVEWREPQAMNGVLRYYVVYYDGREKKVEEVPRVELDGLRAHHNYSIRVAACTVACSNKSEPVDVLTDIGVPDTPLPPTVKYANLSTVRVVWNRPLRPAGPLSYYQIKSQDGQITNTTSTEAFIPVPSDCKETGRQIMYRFSVRAVNIATNNEHLYGNWSDTGEGNCWNGGPSYSMWVIIWIIGSICGIGFVFATAYSSRRIWKRCKAMQDVEVKLPPGLAPNMKLLQKGDQHTRQSSADSSGCSSGQESVTSSLTSDSHVSNDSGAEVDPVMSKKLIIGVAAESARTTSSSPVAWEASSLRQRNVASASKPTSVEATRWADPYVKVAKGSNELVQAQPGDSLSLARSTPNLSEVNVGYATSQQTWSSAGYLSMSSTEEMSSNPSPVPKEITTPGNYSIVGLMPKSPARSKSEEEAISLAKTKMESEIKPTTNPYVSLVSLEQKSKENAAKALDSLRVFDDLGFEKSKQFQQAQPDKLSRPYVQAGFLDTKRKLASQQQPPNFFAQTCLAEDLASKLVAPIPSDSKPYVTVASIPEVTARKTEVVPPPASSASTTTHKPYVAVSSLTPLPASASAESAMEAETKPSISNPVFMMLQKPKPSTLDITTSADVENQEKVGLYPSLDVDTTEELSSSGSRSSSPASAFNLCWQPSSTGDITTTTTTTTSSPKTLTELAQQQPQLQKSASGYVTIPEQKLLPSARFAKPLPQTQPTSQSSEESYSKVAVLPR